MTNHQQRAEEFYCQGRFPQAQEQYRLALEKAPQERKVLFNMGLLALWDNKPGQALDFLHRAYEQSSWLERHWPFNAQIAYRIASAYYRQDGFADAALWYRKAAGPWAVGPLKPLKAFQQQAEAFGESRPYQISGPQTTELPFLMLDPLPVVEVSINGHGPYAFFIDTGGGEVIIQSDLARELGIKEYGSFMGEFAANKKGHIGLSRIDSLQLGGTTVRNLPVYLHSLEGTEAIFERKVYGVIGTSMLRHFYSSIDYAGQKLVLRKIDAPARMEMDRLAEKAIAVPFWLIDYHMMMARGHVNELPDTLFFVDTGLAGSGFLLSQETSQALGIKPDWSQAKESSGGGGKVRYLDYTLEGVTLGEGQQGLSRSGVKAQLHEADLAIFQGALGFEVGGLISHDFFRDSTLTLDFEKMRLLIEPK
jgi:hypothetical protein